MSQDFTRKKTLQVVPQPPILSSAAIADLLRIEHHQQPEHQESECCLPNLLLSIHLGQPIQLERRIEGRYSCDRLSKGDIMITPPYLHRRLAWDRAADFLLLRLEPARLITAIEPEIDLDQIQFIPQMKLGDPLIEQMGLTLKAELEMNGLSDRLYGETMVNALAVHLLRRYSTWRQPIRTEAYRLPNHKLRQVTDYINDHLETEISINGLSALLDMSQYYFSRLFKQSTGYSPYQYVIKRRIDRAQQLMLEEEQSLAHVALQVGFKSQSQFGRHFKRLTGMTPQQFLKIAKK